MTPTTFRERLCALRDAAAVGGELADTEVSDLAGLATSTAGHLLTGRRKDPAADTVVALARLFGVTTDYLLTGSGSWSHDGVRSAVERARAAKTARVANDGPVVVREGFDQREGA